MQKIKFFSLLGLIVIAGSGFGFAQNIQVKAQDGVKIKKVEFEAQQTPNFQAQNVKDKKVPNPREWLELEVEFEVDKVSPRDAVVPELLFRYYIGFLDESNKPITLTGDVTHVNVIGGEEYYSAVYVAPSLLGKITGDFRRLDKGKVKAIGVEIYYNGVLVGGYSSNNNKFWETSATQAGVLSREKTPFALLWIDRYPEVKPK